MHQACCAIETATAGPHPFVDVDGLSFLPGLGRTVLSSTSNIGALAEARIDDW
jgi:hypothetical protein